MPNAAAKHVYEIKETMSVQVWNNSINSYSKQAGVVHTGVLLIHDDF